MSKYTYIRRDGSPLYTAIINSLNTRPILIEYLNRRLYSAGYTSRLLTPKQLAIKLCRAITESVYQDGGNAQLRYDSAVELFKAPLTCSNLNSIIRSQFLWDTTSEGMSFWSFLKNEISAKQLMFN